MNNRNGLSLRMACVMMFQENPKHQLSLEELLSSMDETAERLEPTLALLVKQGIIEKMQKTGKTVYRYQEPDVTVEFEISQD